MKNKWISRLLVLVMVIGAMNMTVSLAAEPGSDQDPLVTLSYLNETFMKSIMDQVDQKIAARNTQIAQQMSGQGSGTGTEAASTFTVVTMSQGQVLTGDIGCEVMLRVGTAACVSPSNPGAVVQNHLYMMTIEGRGVKATAATTKLLVRGSYTIA